MTVTARLRQPTVSASCGWDPQVAYFWAFLLWASVLISRPSSGPQRCCKGCLHPGDSEHCRNTAVAHTHVCFSNSVQIPLGFTHSIDTEFTTALNSHAVYQPTDTGRTTASVWGFPNFTKDLILEKTGKQCLTPYELSIPPSSLHPRLSRYMLFSWNTRILYLQATFGREASPLDCTAEDPKAGERQWSSGTPGTVSVPVCRVQMYVLFSCLWISSSLLCSSHLAVSL